MILLVVPSNQLAVLLSHSVEIRDGGWADGWWSDADAARWHQLIVRVGYDQELEEKAVE